MIGQTISHYKIIEKLGEGGMGVVYKAQDLKLDRYVALKFLPQHLTDKEEAKKRFIHEAKAASALDHPNICNIHEIDETLDGQLFIAMACYEGESLRDRLKAGPMEVETALNIVSQVAVGLSKAHEKDIIHRDIKPANILITSEGVLKIVDFGLAKLEGRTKVTKTGTTVGTLAYMSPEQARGEEVDHRSDIWSLGVVLYELLTGTIPFKGDHEAALMYSIMNEEPPPLSSLISEIPVELDSIVAKMLQKNPDDRYATTEDLISDLRKVQTGAAVKVALPMSRKAKRVVWGLSTVLLIVVVFLVAIKTKLGRQPDVMAAENKLAVMYFENTPDPEDTGKLGDIVTNLLITDLSESAYIQVVSSQRLYDILKLLGQEGVKVIDKELASQVAGKAEAKWMLLGNILQVEPQLVVTSQLVEVASGNAVASQKVRGDAGEEIFSLVDKLTVEVKKDLSLPAAADREPDRPIAEVTTNSQEAYRYYLEGLDNLNIYFWREAKRSFKKALSHDSTLAMAYYELAGLTGYPEDTLLVAKAVEYSSKVGKKEQLLIKARQALCGWSIDQAIEMLQEIIERYPDEKDAYFELALIYEEYNPDIEKLVQLYTKVIELDPLHTRAYSDLARAYAYLSDEDYEKSFSAIDKALSVAPDDANLLDTKGELLALNGKLDEAIVFYKKALEIRPDFDASLVALGNAYLFKREYEKADITYRVLCSSNDGEARSKGRYYLSFIPAYQGKLDAALAILDDGIAADRLERMKVRRYFMSKYILKSNLYAAKGDWDLAREQIEIIKKARGEDYWTASFIDLQILAARGKIAEAEREAAKVKSGCEEHNIPIAEYYFPSLAYIEMAKGNMEAAASYFEKGIDASFGANVKEVFYLAKVYLASGRLGKAMEILEREITNYSKHPHSIVLIVKAHYLLGLAYEQLGRNKKAIEQYEEFLDIWKDADPGIPEVEDAKGRLAKLKERE